MRIAVKSRELNRPSRTATHMDRQHQSGASRLEERETAFRAGPYPGLSQSGQFAAQSRNTRDFSSGAPAAHILPSWLPGDDAWYYLPRITPSCRRCAYYTLQHCYRVWLWLREQRINWGGFETGLRQQTRAACCSERAALINAWCGLLPLIHNVDVVWSANKLSGFVMGTAHSDHWSSQARYFTHVHLITQNWEMYEDESIL